MNRPVMTKTASHRGTLSVARVREFYESDVVIECFTRAFAGQWHTRVAPKFPGIASGEDYICHLLEIRRRDHVLDFGSGVGVTACRIGQRTGCSVRGLNVSLKQAGIANELAHQLGLYPGVKFDVYGGRKFPYEANTFDSTFFFESLCHVPHKELTLKEILRVLAPGRACAGQDWMLAVDAISEEAYENYIRPIESAIDVALVSLTGYRDLMVRAGFRNVRVIDAKEIAPNLASSFALTSTESVRVVPADNMEERLTKGATALSNAFQRRLFTIGFVYGEKPGGRSARLRRSNHARQHNATSEPFADAATQLTTRLMTAEEQEENAFSWRKNVACIQFHRDAFCIPDSPAIAAFVRLVEATESGTAESSCKVASGQIHAARWNLFYHGDEKKQFLDCVFEYLREVERLENVFLNYALVDRLLYGGVDFGLVRKIVTGIDLRSNPADSRLKLWLMLTRSPDLVERAVTLHGEPHAIETLRLHDEFLVGVDLTFDGRSAIKLYPDVTPAELENMEIRQRLSRVLSQEALEAMSRCCWTHVYIAKQNKETVLQFHPSDPDDFVARYLPDVARSKIHAAYRGSRLLDMVVSLPESELRRVPAENFSLYYMPGDYWRLLGGAQGFGLA